MAMAVGYKMRNWWQKSWWQPMIWRKFPPVGLMGVDCFMHTGRCHGIPTQPLVALATPIQTMAITF